MKIGKTSKTTLALLLTIAILSSALAYSLWLYTVENNMSITTYKEVQVEKPLTTKILTYQWGEFNKTNPTKTETFWLRTLTNMPINVTSQTSGLSSAFTFDLNVTKFEFTTYNQTIAFDATLTLVDFSEPPDTFAFDLEFGEE